MNLCGGNNAGAGTTGKGGTVPARRGDGSPSTDQGGLWLVRHARPLVDAGTCYGMTDVAVDPAENLAAARSLARVIAPNAMIHSSPLRRCTALAHALGSLRPDLQWQQDARIAEMDFGRWEGWPWRDIPRVEMDLWTAQFASWRFGGAESVQHMLERVGAAWSDCRAIAGSHVWLTHAGVIRCAMLLARGLRAIERADQWPREPLAFGGLTRLAWRDQPSTT